MIPLDGRAIAGLDEFMLRLGHLVVLSNLVNEIGGSTSRLERALGMALTESVQIPPDVDNSLAFYLKKKKLCAIRSPGGNAPDKANLRYDSIMLDYSPEKSRLSSLDGEPIEIWWQDNCLSAPEIRSRVGAVTAKAKSGSKTGISHIIDWALSLDVISASGELSSECQVLTALGRHRIDERWVKNPYIIEFEKIVLGFLYFSGDLDIVLRLAPMLLNSSGPIKKSDAVKIYLELMERIAEEAEDSPHLSSRKKNILFQQHKELAIGSKLKSSELGNTSTAWHRVSSRLETYVDLGLLAKGLKNNDEEFEYIYYPTEALERLVSLSQSDEAPRDWIESHLIDILLGLEAKDNEPPSEVETIKLCSYITKSLNRPIPLFPIDSLALGLVWMLSAQGKPISIGTARRAIENLALSRPDLARLSRGSFGDRAEFISFRTA